MQTIERTKLTPNELATRMGVSRNKIIGFIRSGELFAIDARSQGAKHAQYKIDEKDIEDFERRRNAAPTHQTRGRATRAKKYKRPNRPRFI